MNHPPFKFNSVNATFTNSQGKVVLMVVGSLMNHAEMVDFGQWVVEMLNGGHIVQNKADYVKPEPILEPIVVIKAKPTKKRKK